MAPKPIISPAARARRSGRYSWPIITVTENDASATNPAAVNRTMLTAPSVSRKPAIRGATAGMVHSSMRRPPTRSARAAPATVPTAPAPAKAATAKPAAWSE